MLTLSLLLTISTLSASGLNIVSRQEWGARFPKTDQLLAVNPPPYVVIHHSGTTPYNCSNAADCAVSVKKIQDFHIDGNGWNDVGYNFLVGQDGNVYEGRGWTKWGAHSPGFNSKSIGLCLIGDFRRELPPEKQINAAKDLIEFGMKNNFVSGDYKLVGHRQDTSIQTDCPGLRLFQEIQQWPHYTRNS